MSLLKVNEVQNYNGSSLTLTASTVSTSAQLNTGGNISVTGSINVSDDSTTRSNLGLGSIATQDSSNVTITGGNISNTTLAGSVTFPAGHSVGEAQFFESTTRVYVAGNSNAIVLSVTPTFISTSNKFLIIASIGVNQQNTGGNLEIQLEYSGTDLATYPQCMLFTTTSTVGTLRIRTQIPVIEYLDVPATGSVQLDFRGIATGSNFEFQDGGQRSTVIIQEFKS